MLGSMITKLTPRFRCKLTEPVIENFVFKLHYQLTVTVLLLFMLLVCAREYFGDPIRCITDKGVRDKTVETYCFSMATFTLTKYYDENLLKVGLIPHPGVGPKGPTDEVIHHKYYQWVPFVLFIQTICFYLPHYIWKQKEGGRIKMLVDGLQYATLSQDKDFDCKTVKIPSKQNLEKKLNIIKKDILLRLRVTRTWSVWLVTMEITNLVNVILQIWAVNVFLNDRFLGLGASIISFDSEKLIGPLESIFPKVTKCIFNSYGYGGSVQTHDLLCVMTLSVVHEKIYMAMWFWFLFLFIVSALAVLWRIASVFLYRRSLRFNELMFPNAKFSKLDSNIIIKVVNGCHYEDWLFLHYLSKNMEALVFKELIVRIAEALEKRALPQHNVYQKKGAEPMFADNVGFDDE